MNEVKPQRKIVRRPLFRPGRKRNGYPHRAHSRHHDLSHHGLHRIRQPADPRQCRNGQRCGVRRHLHCGGGIESGDGALRQLPDRAGAGHGAQRVLRFHCRAGLQIHVAASARWRVLLGRHLLSNFDLPVARIHHQFHPEESQARDLHRRRAVSGHYRAGRGEDRGRPSRDLGHAWRSQAVAGHSVPSGFHPHCRAQ